MGLFKKRENIIDESSVEDALLTALIGGTSIDRQKALQIPAVSSSVEYICNTFAMIPFKLYKETVKSGKRVTKEVSDDRVNIINSDTGDKLDGFQFKKAICEDYLLGQGGYAYIKRSGNNFQGLFYVEDKNIVIQTNNEPIYKNYDILVNGAKYHDYDFIKLLRNTKDGASGVGLTREIDKTLQTAFRRILYEYDLVVTGGSRKGFIKSQKHLDEKSMQALKKAWQDYYCGNANTVILNDGMEFQEASNTSSANEISTKEAALSAEIKDLFHIGVTYDETIKNAIMPITNAFATALNRDFLLEKEKKSYYFAPDTKELYKGSLLERYQAYQIAIKNGFKTRNEIRYMEDDDAIEGLDMVSLGLGDVLLDTNTGKIYVPNTNTMVKMGENGATNTENGTESAESGVNEPNIAEIAEGGEI